MESRNLILAIILSVGVLFIWSFFFEAPEQEMLNGEIGSGDVSEVNSNELDASLYKHDFMMLYSALEICALFVESVILVPVKRIESSSWLNLENSIVICSLSITGSLKSD